MFEIPKTYLKQIFLYLGEKNCLRQIFKFRQAFISHIPACDYLQVSQAVSESREFVQRCISYIVATNQLQLFYLVQSS